MGMTDNCQTSPYLFEYYFYDLFLILSIMIAMAPSPVTLQAVPKLSCSAKIASISAVPLASNPITPVISPRAEKTSLLAIRCCDLLLDTCPHHSTWEGDGRC